MIIRPASIRPLNPRLVIGTGLAGIGRIGMAFLEPSHDGSSTPSVFFPASNCRPIGPSRQKASVSPGKCERLLEPVILCQDVAALAEGETFGVSAPRAPVLAAERPAAAFERTSAARSLRRRGEKAPQQFIVQGDHQARPARVALARGAAEELAVDAAGLVRLGGDDVQPAELRDARRQLDVGAAAGHVRRDRDPSLLSRPRRRLRLALVMHGVEQLKSPGRAPPAVAASCSLASTLRVPTSTGVPRA